MKYETVIGLEIHAELSTESKIFCTCRSEFGGEVNTHCCPICLAYPGTLPVLNERVVEYAIRMGVATRCEINLASSHDRKNYFYSDLPKGYQTTQQVLPICEYGRVEFLSGGQKKRVNIRRVHIEEDTSKLLHGGSFGGTLIDYNRCGVPLIEIVTEPDIRSAQDAKDFLEAVKSTLSALGICDCKMQEGSIRCDVNVSVRPEGQKEHGTRVEMKNVATFNGTVRAIEYESARQIAALEAGEPLYQETRRWDDERGINFIMRSKEDAHDYRYFPDPDLPPLVITKEFVEKVRQSVPEIPVDRAIRYVETFGISEFDARLISESAVKSEFFEDCLKIGTAPAQGVANWINGDLTRIAGERGAQGGLWISPENLCALVAMIEKGEISATAGKTVLEKVIATGAAPEKIADELSLRQENDEGALREIARAAIDANPKSVEDFRAGKTNALGYLVGQCMKASKGKGNPSVLSGILAELIG